MAAGGIDTLKPKYYVTTIDPEKDRFTPQKGVRTGPYTMFGLRKALRKLQSFGYECGRDDPSVLVERRPAKEIELIDLEAIDSDFDELRLLQAERRLHIIAGIMLTEN